jgi:hypothetical protein
MSSRLETSMASSLVTRSMYSNGVSPVAAMVAFISDVTLFSEPNAHEGLPTGRLARRLIDNGEIERILTRLHLLQPRLEGRPALGRFFAEVTEAIGCIRNCRDFEQVIAVTRRV